MDREHKRQLLIEKKKNRKTIIKTVNGYQDFRDACIDAKLYLTPQSYGEVLNDWLRVRYNFKKLRASEKKGDDLVFGVYNTEVKISIVDDGKTAHFVQLRLTHDIDFYLFAVYDAMADKIHYFLLTKPDVKKLVLKWVKGYAHGTRSEKGEVSDNINNPDLEYAFRPVIGSEQWNDLLQYSITDDMLNEKSVWDTKYENLAPVYN